MKKYLKTTSEILEALVNCKDVFEESSGARIFMRNGIIFRELGGETYINAEFNSGVSMYVSDMKLTVGKIYRVRDGRRAFISWISDKYAYGCIEKWSKICKWNLDDCKIVNGQDNTDIVSLWEGE